MNEFEVKTPGDFSVVIDALLPHISARHPAVIALHGELGAGKTTFTQCLAERLGVGEHVTSPTFVIMRSYETTDAHFKKLVHIDAYRIDDEKEIDVLGIPDMMHEEGSLFVIEWPERISAHIPNGAVRMDIAIVNDSERYVTYAD